MFNTFLSSALDVSSNMMISTIFSKDNSYFMINRISLVTFFVLFFMKAQQSNLMNPFQSNKLSSWLYLRQYIIQPSFIIQLVTLFQFQKQLSCLCYRHLFYYFLQINTIHHSGSNLNLYPQLQVCFVYSFIYSEPITILSKQHSSFQLKRKLSLRQPRDKGLTDALSVMVCFIFSFIVFVYEVLHPVQQTQQSDFGINVLFLTTLLVFGLTKHFKVIHQQLTYRSRYYTTIVLILFIAYEMTINKQQNVIKIKLVTPALVLLAMIELYNLRETHLEPSLVVKKVQYNTPSFENFRLHITSNKESQLLLIQLCVNFSFMFVELIYGFISNSLGLLSDSVHMLIDSGALGIGLWASFVSHLEPNSTFPFGYKRVEVLSGFINGVFLLFVVAEIITESLERIVSPEEVLPGKMILVSTIGLGVNLLGLFFFHDHRHIGEDEGEHNHKCSNHDYKHQHNDHKHHEHEHHEHHEHHKHHEHHEHHEHEHHEHKNHNEHEHHELKIEPYEIEEQNLMMKEEEQLNSDCEYESESHFSHHHHHGHNHGHNLAGQKDNFYIYFLGVYLHILADALGSVACIISGIVIYFYKYYIADPITSIVMSIFILTTTVSLLKETSKVLLFQMPKSTNKIINRIQADAHKAKIQILDLNIWSFSPKNWIVLTKLQIQKDQEIKVIQKMNKILAKHKQLRYKGLQVQHQT